MRVLVYEYLCATADTTLPTSLTREGRAMLAAVVEDFARLPSVVVSTLWAESLEPLPFPADLPIRTVSVPVSQERAAFLETARTCDAAFIIAPECGGLLAERFDWVAETNCRWLGANREAIDLCTDKLALTTHLAQFGVPVIPTQAWSATNIFEDERPFPAVIKPRDGAGSQATYLIHNLAEYRRLLPTLAAEAVLHDNAICQPFIAGAAVSVAVLISSSGSTAIPFPVCRQRLSSDGRFHYLGGSVPADVTQSEAIQRTALDACRQVPGLSGYVGVDLLLPESSPDCPVVVEINPRLTTSYLGYRRLTADNLAAWLLGNPPQPPRWNDDCVQFEADDGSRTLPQSDSGIA